MDMYGFYTGAIFDAYEYLGAQTSENGTVFRVFAPNAVKLSIIGEFNGWKETSMKQIYDGNFYECQIPEAKSGMKYKIRIYEKSGRYIDHCDPYGFGMELRPGNASIIRDMSAYEFQDSKWMRKRCDNKEQPLNIYELHLGSWKQDANDENGWYQYEKLAPKLVEYVKENGYNCVELMPICEYPCDESWGYQAFGFFSPTSRYGDADSLKKFIDICHQNQIGVILDFPIVHFAVNDFGLAEFDGMPLYEYPHADIGYNEWGSKNFAHSRGEVQSFLQSAIYYWLKEYHFDGIRMDAISNMIYWQGNKDRGENLSAIKFIQDMNEGLKERLPDIMLIAEDSTAYPNVTKSVADGGLGFDYKWDMGWMNDTLEYFKESSKDRSRDYYKLTFSMHYFYSEKFLMPLSHDEVVHGKATILQKMNGDYEEKFRHARTFYMYMYAHPGKKLNFMGNEIGQLREWDEKKEQDWEILQYPKHDSFHQFMINLNQIYQQHPAFWAKDYDRDGFQWIDCRSQEEVVYSFLRSDGKENILAVFNFSENDLEEYEMDIPGVKSAILKMDSSWECFGGDIPLCYTKVSGKKDRLVIDMVEKNSAKFYLVEVERKQEENQNKKTNPDKSNRKSKDDKEKRRLV